MKQAQVSIFLIAAGVIIILGIMLLFQYNSATRDNQLAGITHNIANLQSSQELESILKLDLESCSMNSIIEANKKIGFEDSVKPQYQSFVSEATASCMQSIILQLMQQNFQVQASPITTVAEFTDESIIVKISYPLTVTRGDLRFQISDFETVLKKTSSLQLSTLASQTLLMESSDRRAGLRLEQGTVATDSAGNPVANIGIKLITRHFDSLNNPLVLGNVVYEGLPDGAAFSNPIEISIEFDTNDRYLSIPNDSISIAWWDSTRKLWIALPTTIKDGVATAQVDHFTKFAVLTGCGGSEKIYDTPTLFVQKYNASKNLMWMLNKGEDEAIDGQVIIPLKFNEMKLADQPFMNPVLKDEETLYGGEEFKDKCDNENSLSDPSMLSYCCCKGDNCVPSTGVQDCQIQQSAEYADLVFYTRSSQELIDALSCAKDPQCHPDPQAKSIGDHCSSLSPISPLEQTKKLDIGYTRKECIGGKVIDKDGDNSIHFIALDPTGATCIKDLDELQRTVKSDNIIFPDTAGQPVFSVKTVTNDPSVTCTATVEFEGANTANNKYPFSRINIVDLKVEKDLDKLQPPMDPNGDSNKLTEVDTSASCNLVFTHDNTGWQVSGEKRTCTIPGSYGLDSTYNQDGSVTNKCAACKPFQIGNEIINAIDFDSTDAAVVDKTNILTANEGKCGCTIDSMDWQYCVGTIGNQNKIQCIKNSEGIPEMIDWLDETNICGDCINEQDIVSDPNCKDVTLTNKI